MSSRRGPRSRASSVAQSDVTATPRRSNRTNPAPSPLPLVNPRESTSYGSGIAALPTAIRRRAHEQDLTETFAGILGPAHEQYQAQIEDDQAAQPAEAASNTNSRGAKGRGRASTPRPAPSRSTRRTPSVDAAPAGNLSATFAAESGVFSDLDAPPSRASPGRNGRGFPVIPGEPIKEPEANEQESDGEGESEESEDNNQGPIEDLAQYRVFPQVEIVQVPLSERLYPVLQVGYTHLKLNLAMLFGLLFDSASYGLQWFMKQPILLFIVLSVAVGSMLSLMDFSQLSFASSTIGRNLQHRFEDVRYTIGQYTPYVAHPLYYVNDAAVRTIGVKVDLQENELSHLTSRTTLTEEAITQIHQILQEPVVLQRDENGNPVIPLEFWQELKRRLLAELPYLTEEYYGAMKTDAMKKDQWEEWMMRNRFRIRQFLTKASHEELEEFISQTERALFREDEVVRLIQKEWRKLEESLYPQMANIAKGITKSMRESYEMRESYTQDGDKMYDEYYKTHDGYYSSDLIGRVQNIAMADHQIDRHPDKVIHRVNHFSFLQGAVIDPGVTSPSFKFSNQRAGLFWRVVLSLPKPNPPSSALTKWDEAGECWCSPNKDGGLQLGILLAHELIPEEIVIEHVQRTATLDPGAMPKHMEMFVKVDDENQLHEMQKLSDLQFPNSPAEKYLSERWVRISSFTFDNDPSINIQHFPITFDLKPIGLTVRHVLIRALDNYGDSDHTCLYRVRLHGQVAVKAGPDTNK